MNIIYLSIDHCHSWVSFSPFSLPLTFVEKWSRDLWKVALIQTFFYSSFLLFLLDKNSSIRINNPLVHPPQDQWLLHPFHRHAELTHPRRQLPPLRLSTPQWTSAPTPTAHSPIHLGSHGPTFLVRHCSIIIFSMEVYLDNYLRARFFSKLVHSDRPNQKYWKWDNVGNFCLIGLKLGMQVKFTPLHQIDKLVQNSPPKTSWQWQVDSVINWQWCNDREMKW